MKVCIIHNYYRTTAPSGENLSVDADINLLRSWGHEVTTIRWDNDALTGSTISRMAAGVTCAWNPAAYRRVLLELQRTQPDVVHFHNTLPQASLSVLYAARSYGRSSIVMTLHNYRMVCANGLLFRHGRPCVECVSAKTSLPAVRHGCYRNSRLATVPMAFSVDLHRHLGTYRVPDAIIVFTAFQRDLLSSAVHPDRVHVKPPHLANPLGCIPWSNRKRRIMYVGRLSPEKGVDVLIEALRDVPDAPPCDIIGDGEARPSLEAKVARLGMAERVRFLGFLGHDAALAEIRQSQLLVIPSVCNEGFPLVLREAMAMGVPVVASRIGSLKDIVISEWNGVLFDTGQPKDLAITLRRLLEDDDRLSRMSENAFLEFTRKYSESTGYRKLLSIYDLAGAERGARLVQRGNKLSLSRRSRVSLSAPGGPERR